ncbi:Flp pilus assembly complex ATPase component TadA [Halorubrum salinarum]|uniref:Flp pilus assembly complex ATPase component TadA n=1 Tax=Halorubrum salinarum TaxID=2739057 RepID=A0A7D4BT51_9EURY|nr:ATPase, T2SS/T4P/T4SS family [Halorubrum salinarum]QKG93880.1 Flp pilus assembly complex ATPase component TadA [Halorubrum salinarum]
MANEDAERSAHRSAPQGDRSASDAAESDATDPDADPTEADGGEVESAVRADPGDLREESLDRPEDAERDETSAGSPVVTDRYTWRSLLTDRGHEAAAERVYADVPDAPAVPADAVALHLPNGASDVVRAAGVDEPFEADGETEVPGHGTPERGTLVVGPDAVVLRGAAVVPTGERVAAPPTPDPVEAGEREDDTADGNGAGGETDEADDADETKSDADEANDVDEADDADEADGDADSAAPEDAEDAPEDDAKESDAPTADGDEDAGGDPDSGTAEPADAGPETVFDRPVGREGVSGVVVAPGDGVESVPSRAPTPDEWDRVEFDPATLLGFDPSETDYRFRAAAAVGDVLWDMCAARYDPYSVPVLKGYYTWENYREEFFLDEDGNPPTEENEEGEPVPLEFTHEDKTEALGFDPDRTEELLGAGGSAAAELADLVDERTVDVNPEVDEDAFFSTDEGHTTLTNRYDLEKAVPMQKKTHFREEERYWVNKPYAFVIVFRSRKENEAKYYAVQPYRTEIETDLTEFLTGKLRTSIKYADESIAGGDEAFREEVIVEEARTLLDRYGLYEDDEDERGIADTLVDRFGIDPTEGIAGRIAESLGYEPPTEEPDDPPEISARPEPAVLAEDARTLSAHQVEKLLYYLKRDFVGYERIDPIKYDINVEDISCDGYNSPVFVYHSEYEQIITNVYHGTDELDDFVVKLAQRSGKGISKRRPQVDATLPDGSRAQLTLGREVSDHGTNYTIRQFNDVPFTPIDLINWKTFSLDEMAFLWLSIENHKSLIFAGGTASGKTTSLNAVSLFIPSNAKIVSIEDTREVELPQRNWIASVTRPSFSDDDKGDIDEFDLLEAALRQRPDYIVMGEIRGEEGRTAFQVMSTGHTTYTTFHADSVGEVLKRFTTDPINVSKTMFTALDLVSIQTSTRVQGKKVRRNKSITEINHYDAENDEINVQDVFQWQAETDEFLQMGDSNTLEDIMFDRGWSRATLDEELRKRRVVLAYLIDRGLNSYAQVAATFQAFINDPETVLALMANEELERSLEDLREMESVLINVDREKEALVPRPTPDADGEAEAAEILESAEDLFETYRGQVPDSVADALLEMNHAGDVEAAPASDHEALAEAAREADAAYDEPAGPEPAPGATDADDADDADADGTPAEPEDAAPSGTPSPDPAHGDFEGVSEAAGDGSGDLDGIDFGEPFDEGVDVLSSPAGPSEPGSPPDAGAGDGADASPDVSEGFSAAEPVEGQPSAEADDSEAFDTDAPDEPDAVDAADEADPADTAAEAADADETEQGDDPDEADDGTGDDIDEWGFDAVEPAEDG